MARYHGLLVLVTLGLVAMSAMANKPSTDKLVAALKKVRGLCAQTSCRDPDVEVEFGNGGCLGTKQTLQHIMI